MLLACVFDLRFAQLTRDESSRAKQAARTPERAMLLSVFVGVAVSDGLMMKESSRIQQSVAAEAFVVVRWHVRKDAVAAEDGT
jgi:hypothetical protein